MMVEIMSDSKRIKEKVHFYVSGLAGAVQSPPTRSRHLGTVELGHKVQGEITA